MLQMTFTDGTRAILANGTKLYSYDYRPTDLITMEFDSDSDVLGWLSGLQALTVTHGLIKEIEFSLYEGLRDPTLDAIGYWVATDVIEWLKGEMLIPLMTILNARDMDCLALDVALKIVRIAGVSSKTNHLIKVLFNILLVELSEAPKNLLKGITWPKTT